MYLWNVLKKRMENGHYFVRSKLTCTPYHECPGLSDVYGLEFKTLYEKYEQDDGKARNTINARDLWFAILDAQMETGTPYLLYKDAVI